MFASILPDRLPRPLLAATLVLGVTAAACGSDSPTAPAFARQFRLTNAQVVVDGVVMNGQTMHQGQQTGSSTFFQAWLQGPRGRLAGEVVRVEYRRPQAMGPMHMQGFLTLWDDGTHGDSVAGDGIYCYLDEDGSYGFHMPDHPPGEYHYEFYGIHHDGHHSNHYQVMFTLTR